MIIATVPIHGENKVKEFPTRAEAERWAEEQIAKANKDYPHATFTYILASRLRGVR